MDNSVVEQDTEPFAVLQFPGCSGCEFALLYAGDWVDRYDPACTLLGVPADGIP